MRILDAEAAMYRAREVEGADRWPARCFLHPETAAELLAGSPVVAFISPPKHQKQPLLMGVRVVTSERIPRNAILIQGEAGEAKP